MRNKKGFSLLELTLVLGVGSLMTFMKFQDMKNEQETVMANAVGSQMRQLGEAVNRYISIRYDKLSSLSDATGTGSDAGPRTCTTTGCEITFQTLINEGLLPSTYSGLNAQKSSYKIMLKRSGTAPNYVINGLITTTTSWSDGVKVRYDLLGKAMQAAGVDSGMTQTATTASGYNGGWTENSSDYPAINNTGLLTYRVGYDSSMYSVYLRRDGTLPMTGNLNMGGQDINNVSNITASGTTIASILQSTSATDVGGNLSVAGISMLKGAVSADNNLTVSGITTLKSTAIVGSTLTVGGALNAGSILTVAGESTLTGAVTAKGIITASGNITTSGQLKGATVASTGRMITGEYLQMNGMATVNAACSPNGLQGRDSSGLLVSCVNGKWQGTGGGFWKAPPPQTIECTSRNSSGGGRNTFHARVDETGQLYTRVSTNYGVDTGWGKGTVNVFVDFRGISIVGRDAENSNQASSSGCSVNWNWG